MSVSVFQIVSHPTKKVTVETKEEEKTYFYSHFKYILILRVIFGYNYIPFQTSTLVDYLLRLYCMGICLSTSVYTFYNMDPISFWPYLFVILEYIITVFISCSFKKSNRRWFFRTISNFESSLINKADYYKKLHILHNVIFSITIITRIFYAISFCFCFRDMCTSINIIISSFITLAVDINQLPRFILFYMIYYQICVIRENFEKEYPSRKNIQEGVKQKSIHDFLNSYRQLLDHTDKLRRPINFLVI